MKKHKAVFLDRDDTIIYDRHYLRDPELVELMPGVVEALRHFHEQGFLLILVSNQSGIARGLITEHELRLVGDRLEEMLLSHGVKLDSVYYCPHGPDDGCDCRKPRIGMAQQAKLEFDLDLSECYMIGDKESDIEFGRNFGARGSFLSIDEAVKHIGEDDC